MTATTETVSATLCDNVAVSGAYCAKPPILIPGKNGKIKPQQYHVKSALCHCSKKSNNNKCSPVPSPGGNLSNLFTVCANKFGCQQPLFGSMLGRRIEGDQHRDYS